MMNQWEFRKIEDQVTRAAELVARIREGEKTLRRWEGCPAFSLIGYNGDTTIPSAWKARIYGELIDQKRQILEADKKTLAEMMNHEPV